MPHLKTALKGTTAGTLDSYPATTENYDAAIAAIKKHFGCEQAIIRYHIQELLNGKKINHEAKQLHALLDKVVAKKAILERYHISWNQIFMQVVEGQLSKSLEQWSPNFSSLGAKF